MSTSTREPRRGGFCTGCSRSSTLILIARANIPADSSRSLTLKDLAHCAAASAHWQALKSRFVPVGEIPPGDETDRLHRWGYRRYHELFNDRQLLGLELSCQLIAEIEDRRVRHALATNLSDLLRYQNMLCRYDTMALKSLDIFSVHGFPVGLVQCESNMLGIGNGSGVPIGSGGWKNIIEKYVKAKQYADAPFETKQENGRKIVVPINGEWIGERLNGARQRSVTIRLCRFFTGANPQWYPGCSFHRPPLFRKYSIRRINGLLLCLVTSVGRR